MSEICNELSELRVFWYSWWQSEAIKKIAQDDSRYPGHASWLEHFPFTQVAELPEGESPTPDHMNRIWSAKDMRQLLGDGVMGGHYRSTEELQHQKFAAALNDILAGLEALKAND